MVSAQSNKRLNYAGGDGSLVLRAVRSATEDLSADGPGVAGPGVGGMMPCTFLRIHREMTDSRCAGVETSTGTL
jgi:hypothetical protein